MQVADKMAVSIHYTLTDDNKQELDSSVGSEPLEYLHGQGNIISGLEDALTGKSAGEKFNVRIDAENAYGVRHDEMIQVIPSSMFEGVDKLEVGMQFNADVSSGPGVVTIIKIEGEDVTIDGNHPLAGEALTFDVEVMNVREASADELEHGHIHGEGCNH